MSLKSDLIAPVLSFPILTTAANVNLLSTSCLLHGLTLRETTGGAPADIDILDGNDANGSVLVTVTLDPGQSIRDFLSSAGILSQAGPFLRVNAGSVRGAMWYRHIPRNWTQLDRTDES